MAGDGKNLRIAFCASEVFPYAKTGGLADVCGALPLALQKRGHEVSVFLPQYQCIDKKIHQVEKVNEGLSRAVLGNNVSVYFINQKEFFDREGLYGDAAGDYPDNLQRFQFFCLGVLQTLKDLNVKVDIVHCHDWQTALIPVYLKTLYGNDPFYSKTRSIMTIHNLAFQGLFSAEKYGILQRSLQDISPGSNTALNFNDFLFYGKINLFKAGLILSDKVTTVSQQYAREIQTKEFGCGLEDVLCNRQGEITGILNGIDYDVWNPATDRFIEKQYSSVSFQSAKQINKLALQKEFGLPFKEDIPVFGFVGRLSHQKGMDLLLASINGMMKLQLQVIILGQGEEKYTQSLRKLAEQYPHHLAFSCEFDEGIAHRIYAGSDLFLMPSCFEPCGLSQMISLRYGTLPVVFKTGGLADSVVSYETPRHKGNGFVFTTYDQKSFLDIIKKALEVYKDKKQFSVLIQCAFLADFTWQRSIQQYEQVYQECHCGQQGKTVNVVGLTGSLATGKSTVAAMFQKLGAQVIDADAIAHQLIQPQGLCFNSVVKLFGPDILSRECIDRTKLAAIVFQDGRKRKELEEIIHPAVCKEIIKQVQLFKKGTQGKIFIMDVPLLFETGLHHYVDLSVVVKTTQKQQIDRAVDRLHITQVQARQRIKAQMSLREKIKLADIVIDNRDNIRYTQKQVEGIWQKLIQVQKKKKS